MEIDGTIEITINNLVDNDIQVDIYTTEGRKVKQHIESQPQIGSLILPIAFNRLTDGIFIVHITQAENSYIHKFAYFK